MSEEVKRALMLGICIIIAVCVWCLYDGWKTQKLILLDKQKLQHPHYSIVAGSGGSPHLVERSSGAVWRYYLHYKDGKPYAEGYTPLERKNLPGEPWDAKPSSEHQN